MTLNKQIQNLESILSQLEDDTTDIDRCVTLYSDALKSATQLSDHLGRIKKEVQVLNTQQDAVIEQLDLLSDHS